MGDLKIYDSLNETQYKIICTTNYHKPQKYMNMHITFTCINGSLYKKSSHICYFWEKNGMLLASHDQETSFPSTAFIFFGFVLIEHFLLKHKV